MIKYIKIIRKNKISYKFEIDDNIYLLSSIDESNNVFFRNYIIENDANSFRLVGKNPFKILQAVTDLTQKFIDDYVPDAIVIDHLSEILEYQKRYKKPNRRAVANYRYLKNIIGYKPHYFISKYIDTRCILSKNGFDYNTLIRKEIYTEVNI